MIRSLKLLAILILSCGAITDAIAQCTGCLPDQGCVVDPPFPNLCPIAPPAATAGEYYETDITFWLPASFTDPGTGFTVSFQQMTITSVSGLPFGLSLQANSPSGIYYPQQNEFGCARICGTPVGPGQFDVTISIIASVVFSGISIDAPQQFAITLVVLPGAGGNNSFTFSPAATCPGNEVVFNALIDASPQPTSWAWDLGNGNTSTAAQPPAQTFAAPGEYTISLQTTISGYFLNAVSISGVNNNWCGDIEEPFCNCGTPFIGTCPDLYFVLSNAAGPVYSSSTANDVTSASWSGLNILLDAPPYSITFWDEDLISSNDNLGTYSIALAPGANYAFNVAGGTAGVLDISLQVVQEFFDTDVITILEQPEVVLEQYGEQLCVSDDDLSNYTWLLNGEPTSLPSLPCITPTGPGLWSAVGTNGFGCSDTSNTVVVCPVIEITRTGNTLSVPSGFENYSWTFNGSLLGSNEPSITAQADGLYGVTVFDANGCEVSTEYLLNTVGLQELDKSNAQLTVYPNPGQGELTVEATGLDNSRVQLLVHDLAGRQVHAETVGTSAGVLRVALFLDVEPGTYLLHVVDGLQVMTIPLQVQ